MSEGLLVATLLYHHHDTHPVFLRPDISRRILYKPPLQTVSRRKLVFYTGGFMSHSVFCRKYKWGRGWDIVPVGLLSTDEVRIDGRQLGALTRGRQPQRG